MNYATPTGLEFTSQVSGIRYQALGIKYQASSARHQVSGVSNHTYNLKLTTKN